jgi:hypothetical protein
VVPAVVEDCTHIGFTPFSTVIRVELGVCQVTLAVTSICSPPAVAEAVKQSFPVAVELSARLKEVTPEGPRTKSVTFPNVTVAVVVALAVPEAAVIVDVPAESPVSNPLTETVATLGVSLDQHTVVPVQLVPPVKVSGFPLLSVPAAVSCCVKVTLTDGLGGSITMLETVGFTKKPLQLTVMAMTASTAKAPARRSLFFLGDIVCLRLLERLKRGNASFNLQRETDLLNNFPVPSRVAKLHRQTRNKPFQMRRFQKIVADDDLPLHAKRTIRAAQIVRRRTILRSMPRTMPTNHADEPCRRTMRLGRTAGWAGVAEEKNKRSKPLPNKEWPAPQAAPAIL